MPQFNPDDGSLPNQGIPERLLHIYDRTLPLDFPGSILQQIGTTGAVPEPVLNDIRLALAGVIGVNPAVLIGSSNIQYFQNGDDHTSWNLGSSERFSGAKEIIMVFLGMERVMDIRFNKDPSVLFTLALNPGATIRLKQPLIGEWQIRVPQMNGADQPSLLILFPAPDLSAAMK